MKLDRVYTHQAFQVQKMADSPERHQNQPALIDITQASMTFEITSDQVPIALAYHQPPNGGLTAWMQILGALLLFFNTWRVHS